MPANDPLILRRNATDDGFEERLGDVLCRDTLNALGYGVVSSNITASWRVEYTVVASATIAHPTGTPIEGGWYRVVIRNGTYTAPDASTYAVAGTIVLWIWHSGSWQKYENWGAVPAGATQRGNVLLGGTNPAAAATVLNRFLETRIDVINQGTANNTGGSAASVVNNIRRLATSATPSSRCQLRYVFTMMHGSDSGKGFFSRAVAFAVCGITWNTALAASTVARFVFGKTSATLVGNLSTPGFGFVVRAVAGNNAEIYGCVHNGTTYAETLIATVAASTQFKAVAISGVGSVFFWVNGSSQTVSGGPTANTAGAVEVTAEVENPSDSNSRFIDMISMGVFDI